MQAITSDLIESLTESFEGFILKESRVADFVLNECNITVKKVTRHPVARNSETTLENRKKCVEKWCQTDMYYLGNCIFVDESAFDINMRPPTGRSLKGTSAVVTTPMTRAITYTILGVTSAFAVINVVIRVPFKPKKVKVDGGRKRKKTMETKPTTKGTVTGHYMRFLQKVMNEMGFISSWIMPLFILQLK